MNYYSHHIGDFNNATRHLTRVERALYRDAIELYYDTESALNLDFEQLCRKLLASSFDEKLALETVLHEFFIKNDVGYSHKRCDAEIAKYRANTSNKAKAGIASAAARKQKLTGVKQTFNEPITNNQEPLTNNHIKTKKPPTATRLTIDWQPSETDYLFAKQERPDINPRSTADQFRDYWIAKSGKDAMKADWSATWRNWVRRQTATPSKQGYESAADKTRKTIEGLTGRASNEQRDFIDIN